MSTATVIKKYRCFCQTENAYSYTWSDSAPTTCPNNNTHTIDPALTTVIDSVSSQNVYITSKAYGDNQGYYMMEGYRDDIPAGQELHTSDVLFPFPVCIFGFNTHTTDLHSGDCIDVIVNPDTVVGVIMAGAAPGQTTFVVSPTVIQYMNVGFNMVLTDGVNRSDCGIVISKDPNTSTITTTKPCNATFLPFQTLVQLNLYVVRNFHFGSPGKYEIGYGTLSGKPMPANVTWRLVYHNNSPGLPAKEFSFYYEYTY